MKARIKGFDDPFKEIETLTMKGVNGTFYVDDVEFEQEPEPTSDHWQDVRERAAIAAIQGILSSPPIEGVNPNPSVEEITHLAVIIADALVKKLKGE